MARHFESDPNESTALRFEQRGAQASAQTGAPASQLGAKQNAYLSGDLGKDSSTVSYTHLTLPTKPYGCRSRWSPYH